MSDIAIPGRRGFLVASPNSWVFEEDKEIAWAGAKERITVRPDLGWIVSKFVDLSPPEHLRPNENGHIFLLDEGRRNFPLIRDTPMNWLHHDRLIVGSYVDVELVDHADSAATDADALPPGAHVETLATFYRTLYPRHWQKVKDAHATGLLYSSAETVPKSVTCKLAGCCGDTFPFKGVWSTSYCDSMQKPGRQFILNDPLWIGGAVVVPPHRPGWANANGVAVATWLEQNLDQAGQMYDAIARNHPDADDEQTEAILAALVEASGLAEGTTGRERQSLATVSDKIAELMARAKEYAVKPPAAALTDEQRIRRDAALEDQANHQGVIVTIVPPDNIARELAALGDEPVDQIHVTLAFLGDSGGEAELPAPDGPLTMDRLNAMVAVFAASEQPIDAKISGLGRFTLTAGNEVTYASIDAPGLNELRARLVEYLHAGGALVSSDHGFTPHAAIQYHRAGEGPTEMPDGLMWQIDAIEMWWGDELHARHHLGGVADDVDQVAATLALEALRALDTLDGISELTIRDFVDNARTTTVQAVLDAGLPDEVAAFVAEALIDRMFTTEQRAELAKKGQAMPDGSFPTPTKADWMNARAAIGRAKEDARPRVIAYLKRRAKALGIPEEEIPDNW